MSAWPSTLLLLLQCLAAIPFGRGISNGYVAKCVFDDDIRITCQVALFSAFSFDINGILFHSLTHPLTHALTRSLTHSIALLLTE